MNEPNKAFIPISQIEAGYTPLAVSATQACSNCRFFYQNGEGGFACQLIENYPEPIVPNGVCNRWEAGTMPEPEPLLVEVVGVESTGDAEFRAWANGAIENIDNISQRIADGSIEPVSLQPNALERIWEGIQEKIFGKPATFKVLPDGKHWVAYYTNNFKDREEEILSEAAHIKYISRLNMGLLPMPELWFWHIPGTKHGKALWVDYVDHIVTAVGEFTDDPIGKAFSEHYRKSRTRYANSHGFYADRAKHYRIVDGVGIWDDYNTFEITVLPTKAAANPFTLFTEIDTMTISPESAAALAGIIGKEHADKIIEEAQKASKEVKDLGVQHKDFTDPATLETPTTDTAAIEALSKNVAPVLLSMAETQGDMAEVQKAFDLRISAIEKAFTNALAERDARLQALESQNKVLQSELALTPRRASTDASTALKTDEQVGGQTQDQLKQRMPGQEYDPFFADMNVPSKG